MTDTPDPAVQLVAEALGGDMWRYHTDAEFHAQVYRVVAALREAGYIKNLRQVGCENGAGLTRHDPAVGEACRLGICTPVYVEEGER